MGWPNKTFARLGYTIDELELAGLSKMGQRGPIDKFRNRLMWPIKDISGDTVGFGARKLASDADDQGPKYLNTSETPIYKKSQVLYGLDVAKKEIAKKRQAVIVEGYTDVMAAPCRDYNSGCNLWNRIWRRPHSNFAQIING